MKPRKAKTARFASLVQAAGQPEVASLWTPPEQDRGFMSAVKQGRVLTVAQEPGASRKDFGEVGFTPGPHKTYLVFPKTLRAFKEQRIVGIKYDLLKSPGPIGRMIRPGARAPKPGPSPPRAAAREKLKAFLVTIRFTAIKDAAQVIRAASRNAARAQAERNSKAPDMSHATITRKVVGIAPAD